MPGQQQNTDLSLSYVRPTIAVMLNLNTPAGGATVINTRLLLLGQMLASGARPPAMPFQPQSQDDCDAWFGKTSQVAHAYASVLAQMGPGAIDVFVAGLLEPSSGAASTFKIIFVGTATSAGYVDIWILARKALTVSIATGDTAAQVATNVKAQLDIILAALPLSCGISSGTLTLTYSGKGAVGEDVAIRCNQFNAAGITTSPGSILFATPAVGAGSVLLTVGSTVVTAALAGGETAAQVAAKLITAINAGGYPFTAVVNAAPAQVDLFFAPGRDARRYSVSFVTTTGTTADVTSQGTVGVGAPDLTSTLTACVPLPAFQGWSMPWTDNTSVSAVATHIEAMAAGTASAQKGQKLHLGWWDNNVNTGAISSGSSPPLTSSPRYAIGWCQDFPGASYELGAKLAAMRAGNTNPAKNWNGTQIKGGDRSPLLFPAIPSRPSGDAINLAERAYGLTPLVMNDQGLLVMDKGRTTSSSTYRPLWSWSCIDQADYWRDDIRADFAATFNQVSLLRFSVPRSAGLIDKDSVTARVQFLMRRWEGQGRYDGADLFASAVQSSVNSFNPNRVDTSFPMSPVLDADQFAVVGGFVSPPQ